MVFLNKNSIKKFKLGIKTIGIVLVLAVLKAGIHQWGGEFLSLNALVTSAIAGAVFIIGFLLSGIMADFKEAEKIPGELRSSMEAILEKGKYFNKLNKKFGLSKLKKNLLSIINNFIKGVGEEGRHYRLEPCLDSVNRLSDSFTDMEKLGMPANYIVRMENEQSIIRKGVLRIYHIQKTQFLPSAHILAESLSYGVILLLLFLKAEGSPETFIIFGFISYLFLFIRGLIRNIEKPFRQGHDTLDDVSLFLLKDLKVKLKSNKKLYYEN